LTFNSGERNRSDFFPSPRGDGIAAFVEFDGGDDKRKNGIASVPLVESSSFAEASSFVEATA
jgi:hypothetical protein